MLVGHQQSSTVAPTAHPEITEGLNVSITQTQDVREDPEVPFELDFLQSTAMNVDAMYNALEDLSTDFSIPSWTYDLGTDEDLATLTNLTPSSGASNPSNTTSIGTPGTKGDLYQAVPYAMDSASCFKISGATYKF
jgi:hypothetical protein